MVNFKKNIIPKQFESFNYEIGVVDRKNPKSIFCDIRFYLEPINTNHSKNINKFLKSIENDVELNIDKSLFHHRFIMAADSPDTMKTVGKGYVTLMFNFFLKNVNDYKKKPHKERVLSLMEQIENNHFKNCELFQITKQKRF